MTLLRSVKGMSDLFENELATWRHVESVTTSLFSRYGYEEIRTPIVEDISVFVRSVGEATDIVEKEMYAFPDKDGKTLCLRPENTASVIRAVLEQGGMSAETERKLYYMGPMFRRERPQKGRSRQFYQFGVEALGISEPTLDVEMIAMLQDMFVALGLDDLRVLINSLGQAADRKAHAEALEKYFSGYKDKLCEDCVRRLHKNPLRILDCKKEGCMRLREDAPQTLEFLGEKSKAHFEYVVSTLKHMEIPVTVSSNLVRGLDYYTDTVFEFVAETGLGAQNTVAGGGRYDGLIETMGGPSIPGCGFAAGMERIAILLREREKLAFARRPDLAIIAADEAGKKQAHLLARILRQSGNFVDVDLKTRSVKAQFRRADRLNARYALVLGAQEIGEQRGTLKALENGALANVRLDAKDIGEVLRQRG